jgi:polyisoprenoid-binding protein YceI
MKLNTLIGSGARTRFGLAGAVAAAITIAAVIGVGPWTTPGQTTGPNAAIAQDANAETVYEVDGVHSMVMFRIKHLGVAYVYGLFFEPEGTFNIDLENPQNSSIDISVPATNIDTGNDSRDNHLKGSDFFNVRRHSSINFTADNFERLDDDTLRATGKLTMVGETREITVDINKVGEGDTRQGYKQGFETEFVIERSDWGMDTYVSEGALGDEVTLMVTMEGKRR